MHDQIKSKLNRMKHLEGDKENVMVYGNKHVRIIGLYRGFKNFNADNKDPLDSLFKCLDEAAKFDGIVLLQGDFNIDPNRDTDTKHGRILANWALENGLTQLIRKSTRRRIIKKLPASLHLEESMIDLAFANDKRVDSLSFSSMTSDHDFLWSKVRAFGEKRTAKKVTIRDYSHMTLSGMKHLARSIPTELKDVNDHHTYILDTLAPERVIRTRGLEQVMNPRIEKAKKKRDRALKKFKKYGDEKYLKKSRRLTLRLKQMIKHETKETFQKKAISPNPKCFKENLASLK